MNITFDRDILMAAITPTMSAVSNKNTDVKTDSIRITAREDGVCILESFDMEKGIRTELHGDVKEAGSFCINGQKLSQIVRNMPERITIAVSDKGQARLTSGRSVFTVNANPGAMFPETPMLVGDVTFYIPSCELRDAISKTLYAVANNDPRPALNGMYFAINENRMTVVASDCYRLAIAEKEIAVKVTEGTLNLRVIVPGKSIIELMKMLPDGDVPVCIKATMKHIIFETDALAFFSRLIDAEYVDYIRFMPKTPSVFVSVETNALRESLERCLLVTEDTVKGEAKGYVKCCFDGEYADVSAVSVNGTVRDAIPIKKEGGNLHIGFNCKYLYEALRACDTEYIRLAMTSQFASILITADEERLTDGEREAREQKREKLGLTRDTYTQLVVPIHMKE